MTTIGLWRGHRFDQRMVVQKRRKHGRPRSHPKRWRLTQQTWAHASVNDGTVPVKGAVRGEWQQVDTRRARKVTS